MRLHIGARIRLFKQAAREAWAAGATRGFMGRLRAVGGIVGALFTLLIAIIMIVVVELVYGYFDSVYTNNLNSTLPSGTAKTITSFFSTTNGILPLLVLIPLVVIVGVVVAVLLGYFGGSKGE